MTHIFLTYLKSFWPLVFAIIVISVVFFVLKGWGRKKAKVVQMKLPVLDETEEAISN